MDEKLKIALKETEFLDGMIIEGNNFKVTQFLSLREHLLDSIERCNQLMAENSALKSGKDQYRHFKGNKYTVICEGVHDEAVGQDAVPDTIYVGHDGKKWRRPSHKFHGLKDGVRRFEKIEEVQHG